MRRPFFYDQHPLTQLLFVALLVIIGFFLFFVIGLISSVVIFPFNFSDLLNGLDYHDPVMIPVLKNLQIWQSIGIFVFPSLLIAWIAAQDPWEFLGLARRMSLRPSLWVIIILLVSIPVMNQLVMWNENMTLPGFLSGVEDWMKEREEMAAGLTNSFLLTNKLGGFIVNILMIAIIPAFGEEFFFRGILQKLFGRWFKSTHLAIILAAIIFSALHFQFYGFFPRFVLGLLFGYLFAWSGNLWYPILAHLFNNLIPVVAYYFYGEEAIENPLEQMGSGHGGWIWFLAGLSLAAMALYQFKKVSYRSVKTIN